MDTGQQQLLEAINALYHHTDSKVKEAAGKWLEGWQQSTEAWETSHRVLNNIQQVEAQYFCSQTLRTKVQRDFEELAPSVAAMLRDSLMALLLRYAKGMPPVRTQLCLALAALTAHLPAAQWGEGGAVQWLAGRLSQEPQDVALPCMLEMLTVLPQEAGSYRPAVRPERRRAMVDELVAAAPCALAVLSSCLSQQNSLRSQVLEAFAAWLKLAGPNHFGELDGGALAGHPLVLAAVEGLRGPDFDAAVEAVLELIYCTQAHGVPAQNMLPLVQLLVPAVLALRPRFVVATQRAEASRAGREATDVSDEYDDDDDTAKGMARLFAELGESYIQLIASGAPDAMPIVEALLEVAAHPEDAICAMSFNFWHRLARLLTSPFSPQPINGEDSDQATGSEQQRRVALFVPAFERLAGLIRGRVAFPADYDSMRRDERADFRHSRNAVGDALYDAAGVIGGARTLALLMEPLMALGRSVAAGGQFDWREAEAALYCIRAVYKVGVPPGDPLLLSLFAALPTLPGQPQVQYTAAMVLAAYAGWLAQTLRAGSPGAAGLLPQLLQTITQGLGTSDAARAAAIALKNLCEECAAQMAESLDALLQLYQRALAAGVAAGKVAAQVPGGAAPLAMEEEDVQEVVEGVTLAVSALPDSQRRNGISALLMPLVQPIQALLEEKARGGSSGNANGAAGGGGGRDCEKQDVLLGLLERLTTVFRFLKDPPAVADALQACWQLLEAAFRLYNSETRALERLARAPRYAVRSAGKHVAPALPALLAWLPAQFGATRNPCFLFVASELVKVFGDEPAREAELGQLVGFMLREALAGLKALPDFDAAPDLADDIFLLAGRVLAYCPRALFQPALLAALLDALLAGVLVQHREACISLLTFLQKLLDPEMLARAGPASQTLLLQHFAPRAPQLARLLLAAAAGGLPQQRTVDLADTLLALLRATRAQGLQWVSEAVEALPDAVATPADRRKLLQVAAAVAAEDKDAGNSGQLEDAVEEMSELCRRNRRAMDAAQRALLPPDVYAAVTRREI